MDQFHFTAAGFTKKHLRRWKNATRHTPLSAYNLILVVVVAAVLYSAGILKPVRSDEFGNREGDRYDLIRDFSFDGLSIAVLHLYVDQWFDFKAPTEVLKMKGFKIHRWTEPPDANEFAKVLKTANQLWIISSDKKKLNEAHLKEIKQFFDRKRGIYIWGDNEPFLADANYVASALFDVTIYGNKPGQKVIQLQTQPGTAGFVSHPVTTGIDYLFEGHTVATIHSNDQLQPLIYGSADNLLAAVYDKDGKRAIVDGGFTRLYLKLETAGTGRYIKNAATWLANIKH